LKVYWKRVPEKHRKKGGRGKVRKDYWGKKKTVSKGKKKKKRS